LGVTLAPLRIPLGDQQVSALDLDMLYETSEGASDTVFQVGVLRLSGSF
jgi:hypothetical protein